MPIKLFIHCTNLETNLLRLKIILKKLLNK